MAPLNLTSYLQQQLLNNGHHYSDDIQQRFLTYLALLDRWNQKYNLTAIRNMPDMITHHLLDSLTILPYLYGERIIDVGSGAGLPGLIVAMVQPDKSFFLLDSNSKKTRFLTQVVLDLGLKNVTILHSRSEQYHPDRCFDQVITRAFSSLKKMLDLTQHLICPEGGFLAMKGLYPHEEIQPLSKQWNVVVHELKIKGLNERRCLVVITGL
jgi:16S rRNA (guanine527-N7)-methyltransferase